MGYITAQENLPVFNKKRLCIYGLVGVVFAAVAIVLACINPIALISKYNTRLTNGSPIHEVLKKKLDGVHVETYLFNITNAERFLNGQDEKLKVEEVGPFTYKESRKNEDLELDEEKGVLRYTPVTSVTFLPEESVADPKDINVTMPNIAFLSVASTLSSYSAFATLPFNLFVRRVKTTPVNTIDAHNYMWGYDEPLITLGHTMLPGMINFPRLGILDRMYDIKNKYRLEVGATNANKFQIQKLNDVPGISNLKYDDPKLRSKCNTFTDTYEGIAYPPNMTPGASVRIWRNVLCRILELDFVEQRPMDYGSNALVYTISNRTYNYNPDKMCLCKKAEVCYNGISDLSSCFYGLPLAISNAHFLGGEPKLFRKIEGLNPDANKHGSIFMIEPTIGMALETSFTVQMNVVVEDIKFNNDAAAFSNMVVPIAYFRIVQPPLKEHQIQDLRMMCIYGPKIFLAIEIVCFIIGISLVGYSIRQILWNAACGHPHVMNFTLNVTEKEAQIKAVELPLMTNVDR